MKMLETQLEESRVKYFEQEKKKGFSEAAIRTTWNEKVAKTSASIEEKLSIGNGLVLITESGKKINRGNGGRSTVVTESDQDLAKEVQTLCRQYGVSAPEAVLTLKGGQRVDTYGLSEKQIRESWCPFAGILTESEIDTLVERKVPAPRKG